MVVVHIHGTTQCTEVRANSVEEAILVYIRHNACWLCDWQGTIFHYEPDNTTIRQVVADFGIEACTITRIENTTQVFCAKWEDA